MNRRLAAVVLAVAVLPGACDADADADGDGDAATTSTDGRAPSTTTERTIRVVLGAGRLTVGGNALVVTAPASQVDAYLERALGDPDESETRDCDPGRLQSITWPGLVVYVGDTGFAGWYADDDTFSTDKGLTVGSTEAELRAAHPDVTITESTLGTEAFVPDDADDDEVGLSALLEDGRISDLWSGATCVSR